MNIKHYSLVAAICLVPSISLADFYIGLGAQYQVTPVDTIDGFDEYTSLRYNDSNMLERYEVDFGDIYQDSRVGANLTIGYQIDESMAVEFSYFNSENDKKLGNSVYAKYNGGDPFSAKSDIETEAFKLNLVGAHKVESVDKLSLLGSAGILYQNTGITRAYVIPYACAGSCDETAEESFTVRQKKNFHDTDLQLGAGLLYEVNDQFDVRGMVHLVPDGFSFGNKTPYSVSAEVLYKF
mgnify:CR=1 FL=1